ncbi:hypothetical protein DV515_00012159 [Chloebia gouldiae]|uniref:Uncharacterized protein n=1 Tax=Chloebia gouldiae TaxID=44316 RepID=A0A3L8S4C0_CHLGU|nr:hypothetical protein DV515_00012159 [Chloebia gouldiae]
MDHPLPGHHPSSEAQRFTDIMSHPPGDSPSPEPNLPGSLHSMSAEVFGPSPPFSSISVNGGANYGNHLSHPPEMNEAAKVRQQETLFSFNHFSLLTIRAEAESMLGGVWSF